MTEAAQATGVMKWLRLETLKIPGLVFWLAAALLFVFSLPHVMALRNVLLLVLLLLVTPRLLNLRTMLERLDVRIAMLALLMLIAWMLYVSVFLAPDSADSLRSFIGEWGRAILVFIVGVGVAFSISEKKPDKLSHWIVSLIFLVGLLHMMGHAFAVLLNWLNGGGIPSSFPGITDHRANVTFVFAMMLAAIGADVCSRYAFGRSIVLGGRLWITIAVLLGFVALITSSTTNGWIVSIFLALMIGFVAVLMGAQAGDGKSSKKRVVAIVASAFAFLVVGVVAVGNDSRYEGFEESVALGWDTEGHLNWLHGFQTEDWPVRANGETVDPSTYTRVAWAKEGAKLLVDHPWGTEISKYTFSRLISEKYGVDFVSHSHIGLIDFGLNVGLPGIVLWLTFLVSLAWLGWSVTRNYEDAVGLCLLFFVAAYTARMMIDSVLRDHMLEQFMFCVGMLMVACASLRQRRETVAGR